MNETYDTTTQYNDINSEAKKRSIPVWIPLAVNYVFVTILLIIYWMYASKANNQEKSQMYIETEVKRSDEMSNSKVRRTNSAYAGAIGSDNMKGKDNILTKKFSTEIERPEKEIKKKEEEIRIESKEIVSEIS